MAPFDMQALADSLSIPVEARELRLREAMKIDPALVPGDPKGRVVLMTAMTPTPAGEGKTTTAIGLVDALRRRGVRAVAALREPSLGPLFGLKGGAIGGGRARIVPDAQINMHFTGDIHAVTSAHNLLASMTDNHATAGHEPRIAKVTWGRVLDMNDRHLRQVEIGFAAKAPYRSRFDITAASEVMAILCLSSSVEDLRARLSRIVVGQQADGKPVTAKDVRADGAMAAILLEAARPNLVRTLEGTPVFVHGGPFANVAQGTSTLMQTTLARKVADVVVTEGGFAFDLGGFKFLDIKCRAGGMLPAAVVLVATVRALRFHGGRDDYATPDLEAVRRGLENVAAHVEAMARLGLEPPIVALNRFQDDTDEELALVHARAKELGVEAVPATHFVDGGDGALALADVVARTLRERPTDSPGYRPPYALSDDLPTKVAGVARAVFGASGVELTEQATAELREIEAMGHGELPLCLAKTHLSISDDAKVRGRPAPFTLRVTSLRVAAGAGFVVALCGPILTMPGLPAKPAAWGIDIERGEDGRWQVCGLK